MLSKLFAAACLLTPVLSIASPIQWKTEDGGNGHWYDVVRFSSPISWHFAQNDALSRGGYLAELSLEDENQWVRDNVVAPSPHTAPDEDGPYLGVTCEGRAWGDWYFLSGEPFAFSGWGSGEPSSGGNEQYVQFWRWSGLWWNDITEDGGGHVSTYVLEKDVADSPTYAHFLNPSDTILVHGNTVFVQGDFTYEMHVWFDPGSYGQVISEQRDTYEDKVLILGDNRYNVSTCYASADGNDSGTLAELQPGRWMHLAYVKHGADRTLYVDGMAVLQFPPAINCYGDSPDSWMSLGMFRYGAGYYPTAAFPSFLGKLDWIRVSNVARYTSAFLPPLESGIVTDAQTQLLLRFNEPAGTATLIDESPNHFICEVGVPVAPGVVATSPLLGQTDGGCLFSSLVLGPSPASLLPTQVAIFTVSAEGTALSYQWQKDSVDLVESGKFLGTTTNWLTVTDVQTTDQGEYRCVISGACGNVVSQPASLSCKPIITTQPPTHAPLKRTLQLSVGVPDSAPYSYRWQRNGVELSNTPGTYSGATTRTLRILAPDFLLGGTFTCQLTDVCGGTLSGASKVCLADFNADEYVDDSDFVDFARAYDTLVCDDPTMSAGCPADFNNDTVVDDSDFVLFVAAYDELLCP